MKKILKLALLSALLSAAPAAAQNTLSMNMPQNFGTIDPAKINDFTQYLAAINLYDGLLGITSNDQLVAHVASKWTVSPDGKTYTFTIRPGIKFHSGNTLSAADVVYSMKRILAINQGPAFLWGEVLKPENVTASSSTVKMVLNKPFSPFLATMSLLFVVDSKTLQAKKADGKFGAEGDYGQAYLGNNDAGSGPYTLGKLVDGTQMTINRNKTYFKKFPAGAYDTVNVLNNGNDATLQSMAKTGQLQMTSQLQTPEFYSAMAKLPGWKVLSVPSRMVFYLKMNNQRAPFDDVNVRKAVAAAIDYKTLQTIYPSAEARGVLAPSFGVHNKGIPALKQDMAAAKALMAKSKYAGQQPTIDLAYISDLAFEQKVGLLVQANLAEIGIKVNLMPVPWTKITEMATKVETTPHLSEIFFVPTYPSANSVFYTQYHSEAPKTWATSTWTKDAEVDKLIDQALAATNQAALTSIYGKLQQRLHDIQTDIPLGVQQSQFAMQQNVNGYKPYPVQAFDLNFFNLYKR